MQAAENIIERFPTWSTSARQAAATRTEWVSLGSEYDLKRLLRLWQLVMRFRLVDLPDDEGVMWQLADKLVGRSSELVMIRSAEVFIDRRHMVVFREAMDWLWDELCEDHHDDFYEAQVKEDAEAADDEEIVWIRKDDAPPPMTKLEESQTAIDIIDALRDGWVDNVVKLWEMA